MEGSQVKAIRKDGAASAVRPNGSGPVRPALTASAPTSRPTTPSLSIPYRGTAGTGGVNAAKASTPITKKPTTPTAASPAVASKPPVAATKPTGTAAAAAPAKKVGYLAILEKAKEIQKAKPAAPPMKHERTKILTKEERLALRAEAKGKKPAAAVAARGAKPPESKTAPAVQDRKKSETGYQGTARPKEVKVTYKGTARPAAPAAAGKAPGYGAAKPKAAPQGRYNGYASWSDLDEEDVEDDEEGYESSDMEAGAWDVDQEEERALKEAKKEDAIALAEEEAARREKERRKQKLLAEARERAKKRRY